MKKILLYGLIIMYHAINVQGQLKVDSLLKLLPAAKEDSNAVLLYINIGQQYENNETAKAKYYFLKANELSRKINYTPGMLRSLSRYSYALGVEGAFDSCLIVNQQTIDVARKYGDSVFLAKALFNTGTSYSLLGDLENTAKYYEEGKNIFGKLGNVEFESTGNDMLQLLYYDLKQYNRAIGYGEKAVAALRKLDDPAGLGRALNNLGLSYQKLKRYDKAEALYKESLGLAVQSGDKKLEATAYLALGDILIKHDEYEKFKPYYDKALALAKEIGSPEKEINATEGLMFYWLTQGNYQQAQQLGKQALALSYQYQLKEEREDVFIQLSNLAYAIHDIKAGEYYAEQSSLTGDSILNETMQKNIADLEKKYETGRKNTLIKQLEVEKEVQQLSISKKNTLNYFLIAGAAALLIISLLSYRTYRQKRKLQQQRITELETEKQLMATEAVLKGEEQERTRLAKDLHDGLGGMLSGIKYSFNNMKDNLVMTPENNQAFERSMDMLDNSIKEMRRVAHNMMPEALIRYGLDKTLQDYVTEINKSGMVNAVYQSMGMENKQLDNTTSITIYRIVQELLNNVLKHAGAKQVLIQLLAEGDKLVVNVEDDGKGFDTSIIKKVEGIGWKNIQSRIDFLKGKLDVQSSSGKGTNVNMEFNI
jgi:two-component system, NarL family, sensor kinase